MQLYIIIYKHIFLKLFFSCTVWALAFSIATKVCCASLLIRVNSHLLIVLVHTAASHWSSVSWNCKWLSPCINSASASCSLSWQIQWKRLTLHLQIVKSHWHLRKKTQHISLEALWCKSLFQHYTNYRPGEMLKGYSHWIGFNRR